MADQIPTVRGVDDVRRIIQGLLDTGVTADTVREVATEYFSLAVPAKFLSAVITWSDGFQTQMLDPATDRRRLPWDLSKFMREQAFGERAPPAPVQEPDAAPGVGEPEQPESRPLDEPLPLEAKLRRPRQHRKGIVHLWQLHGEPEHFPDESETFQEPKRGWRRTPITRGPIPSASIAAYLTAALLSDNDRVLLSEIVSSVPEGTFDPSLGVSGWTTQILIAGWALGVCCDLTPTQGYRYRQSRLVPFHFDCVFVRDDREIARRVGFPNPESRHLIQLSLPNAKQPRDTRTRLTLLEAHEGQPSRAIAAKPIEPAPAAPPAHKPNGHDRSRLFNPLPLSL